jgi:hypothetical protein
VIDFNYLEHAFCEKPVSTFSQHALEHFPEKRIRFSEEEMLQYYELARFLIGQTSPSDRKARWG